MKLSCSNYTELTSLNVTNETTFTKIYGVIAKTIYNIYS